MQTPLERWPLQPERDSPSTLAIVQALPLPGSMSLRVRASAGFDLLRAHLVLVLETSSPGTLPLETVELLSGLALVLPELLCQLRSAFLRPAMEWSISCCAAFDG